MAVFPIIAGAVRVSNTITSAAISTNTNGAAVNIADVEGNILVVLNSGAASTGDTLDLTIEESATGTGAWTAVPADALFDPATGLADTFDQVTDAAASFQTKGLVRERLKQYIRAVATVGGGTISIPISVAFICPVKYV